MCKGIAGTHLGRERRSHPLARRETVMPLSALGSASPIVPLDEPSSLAVPLRSDAETAAPAWPIDRITRGASGESGPDPASPESEAVSNAAKGVAADRALPQRYRLKAVNATVSATGTPTTHARIDDMRAGRTNAATGKPAGMWAVRTDAPHAGSPTYHLNLNPKLTGKPDPHTPISSGVYRAAGGAARLLESVDKAALPAAISIDTARLGAAYVADGDRAGTRTLHTAGSVAGGWAGAAAGAAAGAEGGAWAGGALGALFGGVGAVPGAAIGGVVGGLAGGIAGSFAGSAVGERAVDVIER